MRFNEVSRKNRFVNGVYKKHVSAQIGLHENDSTKK
jgi:hypothetical protein